MMKVEIDAAELQAQFNAAVLQTAFGKQIQAAVDEKVKKWNEGGSWDNTLQKEVHAMMEREVREAVQRAVAPRIAELVAASLTEELLARVVTAGINCIEFKLPRSY